MNKAWETIYWAIDDGLTALSLYLQNGDKTSVFVVSVCLMTAMAAIAVIALVVLFRLLRFLGVGALLSALFSRDGTNETRRSAVGEDEEIALINMYNGNLPYHFYIAPKFDDQ